MRNYFNALLAFTLTLVLAAPVLAGNARLANRGERVPINEIATLTQKSGENSEQFLVRAAGWFHNYTSGTNEEACANICAAPDGALSIRILTNGSHMHCALADRCAPGASLTANSIHSHPLDENFRINDVDRAFMRDANPSRNVGRYSAFKADSDGFSPQDYGNGSGYLVAKGKLLHQAGRGTARVINDNIVPIPLELAVVP